MSKTWSAAGKNSAISAAPAPVAARIRGARATNHNPHATLDLNYKAVKTALTFLIGKIRRSVRKHGFWMRSCDRSESLRYLWKCCRINVVNCTVIHRIKVLIEAAYQHLNAGLSFSDNLGGKGRRCVVKNISAIATIPFNLTRNMHQARW